jgi:hypothetical protein
MPTTLAHVQQARSRSWKPCCRQQAPPCHPACPCPLGPSPAACSGWRLANDLPCHQPNDSTLVAQAGALPVHPARPQRSRPRLPRLRSPPRSPPCSASPAPRRRRWGEWRPSPRRQTRCTCRKPAKPASGPPQPGPPTTHLVLRSQAPRTRQGVAPGARLSHELTPAQASHEHGACLAKADRVSNGAAAATWSGARPLPCLARDITWTASTTLPTGPLSLTVSGWQGSGLADRLVARIASRCALQTVVQHLRCRHGEEGEVPRCRHSQGTPRRQTGSEAPS